jgi:hypothetical protein
MGLQEVTEERTPEELWKTILKRFDWIHQLVLVSGKGGREHNRRDFDVEEEPEFKSQTSKS